MKQFKLTDEEGSEIILEPSGSRPLDRLFIELWDGEQATFLATREHATQLRDALAAWLTERQE